MARNSAGKNQHLPAPPDDIIRPWVENYFAMNVKDTVMIDLLKEHYDTSKYQFGLKTLKRRRAKWGLKSTRQQKHTPESIAPTVAEIRERFPNRGAEGMRRSMLLQYGMKASRHVIGAHLRAVEPQAVKKRRGRRFRRTRYHAAGVNEVWAQDQHDKWGHKFGLWFHGCIDPYATWLVWLMVWWTNSNPRLITKYYLDACRDISGAPLVTQSDPGSENNGVANVHTTIRHTLDPSLRDTRQHRIMSKHNNIKPESMWSIFRRDFTPGFENIFDWGVNHGLYDVNDPLERLVFRWLAIPWIQAELDSWVMQRNFTAPRHDKNKILPQGIPAIIRQYPHKFGGKDFRIGVPDALFDKMEAESAPPDHPVFQLTPPAFDVRANKYYEQMGRPPVSSKSFWTVYQELLKYFKNTTDDITEEFTQVLSGLDEMTRRISEKEKEELKLIPGLKPLRLGATVVGGDTDGYDSDVSFEAVMTDDEDDEWEEEVGSESEDGLDNGPPTFVASMTPTLDGAAGPSSSTLD